MSATLPTALGTDVLAQRLVELAGEERQVLVDFLLHLDEFDRRRAFLGAGYDSLWTYCLQVLHLREGPAGRRIAAMRVLRRFPALEGALRDGRLGMTTVTVLGPLLTSANLDELVGRAAYRTKAEVEQLVATLQPRAAPRDGIRKLPEAKPTVVSVAPAPPPRLAPLRRARETDPSSRLRCRAFFRQPPAPTPRPLQGARKRRPSGLLRRPPSFALSRAISGRCASRSPQR